MNWTLTVHLSHLWNDSEIGFEEKRDGIVAILRASRWRKLTPYPDDLDNLIDELECSADVDEFDGAFSEIYDRADIDGVWIETHGKVVKL